MKTRGLALPQIDPTRCTGCGWCVAACPPHVLSLHAQDGVKVSALDDADACTGCALCAVRCPFDAIAMVKVQIAPNLIAVRADLAVDGGPPD